MLQYYDFNAQKTGASFPVASPGRFLYYLSGSAGGADSTIAVRAGNTGQSVLLKPGQSVRLADSDKTVDTWFISNYAKAQPILGQLLVGDGFFDDNRISGSVEVSDGGKARTLGGSAFVGYALQAGTAGNLSQVMLYNNGNGNKNLFIEQISIFVGTSAVQGIGMRAASASIGGTLVTPKSKKIGSADSATAEIRCVSGAVGGTVADTMMNISPSATIFKCTEPILVPPGKGLLLFNGVANDSLGVNFEFFEEAV